MTDRNKFEEMLERLINEDRDGAEELFHEIVVEKSREIYQNIIESEDEDEEEVDESEEEDDDEELDESYDDEDDLDESDDDDIDEMFGLDELAPGDGSDSAMGMMGGDATDDMMGDIGGDTDAMGGMGDMDSEKPATKGDISSISSDIEKLKSEFEEMIRSLGNDDEEGDDMDDMDDMDGDDEGDDEEEDDMDDMDDEDSDTPTSAPSKEAFTYEAKKAKEVAKKDEKKPEKKTAGEQMREYVEKVSPAKMGDNGNNSKSIVASKNDMGGTTANILRTDTENSGEANKGHLKGSSLFKGTAKENNAGNVNVPGGKAGKTAFKKSEPGHGAERKGKPETADKGAASLIKTTVRNR